jgi:uncharacterized protein
VLPEIAVKRLSRLQSILLADLMGMNDDGRDLPVRWSIMHMFTCAQLAKLIALRRGIDPELAGLAGAVHDIATMVTGKSHNHAAEAVNFLPQLLERFNASERETVGAISTAELHALVEAAVQHSDKAVVSSDPLGELLKDADCLEQYLYGLAGSGPAWSERVSRVLEELGISVDSRA